MMRGKFERKDSKIREIYMSQLENRRYERHKNSVSFVQVNEISEKLDQIKERASRQGKRDTSKPSRNSSTLNQALSAPKSGNVVVPQNFSSVSQFYENAFSRQKRGIQIRAGTPISDASSN